MELLAVRPAQRAPSVFVLAEGAFLFTVRFAVVLSLDEGRKLRNVRRDAPRLVVGQAAHDAAAGFVVGVGLEVLRRPRFARSRP
jgi:hypothetical protein